MRKIAKGHLQLAGSGISVDCWLQEQGVDFEVDRKALSEFGGEQSVLTVGFRD